VEYFNNILCVTGRELIVSAGNPKGVVSENNFKKWLKTGKIKNLNGYACYGVPARYPFRDVPERYRSAWVEKNGDPEKKASGNAFLDNYVLDETAVSFYKIHVVEYGEGLNDKHLSDEKQQEYVWNASVLNAIGKTLEANRTTRKVHGLSKETEFWEKAAFTLRLFMDRGIAHTLPWNPRRLQYRYEKYVKGRYEILIHRNYRNRSAMKITPEAGEWLVAQWMSQVDRVTVEGLYARYNEKAKEPAMAEDGWKTVKSAAAIRAYLFRPEVEAVWHAARYGELSSKEKYSRQHKTILPIRRDALWYSDGTKLNYFYRDELGNVKTCNVYEVMDVYSECFLGYHISKSEDYEAQYFAWKMAIRTAGCKPYEIRYDNQGGHKKLESADMLKNMAHHSIRTAPYNGKSKTIESAFKRFQEEYMSRDWFFTGQNVTAKKQESKPNMEFILANTHKLPTLDEVKEAYRLRREEWNSAAYPGTEVSRKERYAKSTNEKAQKIHVLDMIELFGVTTREARQYTASGIEIEIKGRKHAFEVLTADGEPDMDFNRRNIGRKFYRRYQPDDLSVVGLYEKDSTGMRFIALAQPYLTVHRAIQDQTEEDFIRLRRVQVLNKQQRIDNEVERSKILEKHGLHPHQHGLEVAPLKGVTSGKKQRKDIGQYLKEESEVTAASLAERKHREVVRAQIKKQKQEEDQWEDNYRDYLRKKKELELVSAN
jgi:hypothetical protein